MLQALQHVCAEIAAGEADHTERALLAGQFLALHEIEQRHQAAGDVRIGGGVGRLEHHCQQPADQPHQCRRGVLHADGVLADAPAQRRQLVEAVQGIGDAGEQAGLLGAADGVQIDAIQIQADVALQRLGFQAEHVQLLALMGGVAAEVDVRVAALLLQRVHQLADTGDQFAGARQVLQAEQFAAPGRQHEAQGRRHFPSVHGRHLRGLTRRFLQDAVQ